MSIKNLLTSNLKADQILQVNTVIAKTMESENYNLLLLKVNDIEELTGGNGVQIEHILKVNDIEEKTGANGVQIGSVLKVDDIVEKTGANGVQIGSVLKVDDIVEKTGANGVQIGSVLKVDDIVEKTGANGVQIGSILKVDVIEEKTPAANIRMDNLVEIQDGTFNLMFDGTDPFIQFDGGDHLTFDRSANQFQFKVASNPNPDVCIADGETIVSTTLKIGTAANNLSITKQTTGGDNRDVNIVWEGANVTDYDDSADSITTTLNTNIVLVQDGANNRIETPSILFSGANQTAISSHEVIAHTTKWDGPFPITADTTVDLIMIGNTVTCRLPAISETGDTVASKIFSLTDIPVRYRPTADITFVIRTFDNDGLSGTVILAASGLFSIQRTVASGAGELFLADVNVKGFDATSFSYIL